MIRFSLISQRARRLFILALIMACSASPIEARKKKPVVPPLADQVDQILKSSSIGAGFFGIEVFSLDQNQVVYEKDAEHLFVPASNTKLFTIATAMARLPNDFRFHTTLESAGRVDKYGRLNGDLILVGRGDPNLSNRVLPYDPKSTSSLSPLSPLENLADQLVAKGIKVIDGDVVGDDSYFVYEPYGDSWGWDDLMWGYGAPVSALTINDNVFSVSVQPGESVGDKAFITVSPFYPSFQIDSELRTGTASSERSIHWERKPGSHQLHSWGNIPIDGKPDHESISIEDPGHVAAEALAEILERRGIVIYGRVRAHHREYWESGTGQVTSAPKSTVLAELVSAPLIEDLKVIAKVSQNLHAEMLLRTIGAQVKGEGSVKAGLAAEKDFLKDAGLTENEVFLNDGSGMDPHNLVSPHAVVQLLKYVWAQPYRPQFIDLLPVSATDGTIASRFRESAYVGQIFAKTGTLTHVNALSGFATSLSGEHFTFSIFVNNHAQDSKLATSAMDKVLETILGYEDTAKQMPKKKGK